MNSPNTFLVFLWLNATTLFSFCSETLEGHFSKLEEELDCFSEKLRQANGQLREKLEDLQADMANAKLARARLKMLIKRNADVYKSKSNVNQ